MGGRRRKADVVDIDEATESSAKYLEYFSEVLADNRGLWSGRKRYLSICLSCSVDISSCW